MHTMQMTRDDKRLMKDFLRGSAPKQPKPKTRFLVSVWLDDKDAWMEDMRFRYLEDAQVHAARWGRIYGVTVTQISEIEV